MKKTFLKSFALVAVGVMTVGMAGIVNANLVVNGGFENPAQSSK